MPVPIGQASAVMQNGPPEVGGERQFRLTVIRHGETLANRDKILQGHMDCPLSDKGREQARQLGRRLRGGNLAAAFTSSLCRASETADLILSEMDSPLKARRREELKERSFGNLEGQPTSELHRAAQAAQQSVVDFTPQGGETLPCVQRRANAFCDYLCQMVGGGEIHSPKMESAASFTHFPVPCCSCDVAHAGLNGLRRHAPMSAQNGSEEEGEEEERKRVSVPGDEVQLQGSDDQPHIMVVSHGGFMRCLFKHFYDKHRCKNLSSEGFKATPPNTSLNTFVFTIKWSPGSRPPPESGVHTGGEWKVTAMECLALHDSSGQLQ